MNLHKTSRRFSGRDYERYVGDLHEGDSVNVEYLGIAYGYKDLGRDLIWIKEDDIRVVSLMTKCQRIGD